MKKETRYLLVYFGLTILPGILRVLFVAFDIFTYNLSIFSMVSYFLRSLAPMWLLLIVYLHAKNLQYFGYALYLLLMPISMIFQLKYQDIAMNSEYFLPILNGIFFATMAMITIGALYKFIKDFSIEALILLSLMAIYIWGQYSGYLIVTSSSMVFKFGNSVISYIIYSIGYFIPFYIVYMTVKKKDEVLDNR